MFFCWLSTSAQAQVVVHRVNAGGRAAQAADVTYPDWSQDEQAAEDPPPIGFAREGIPSIYVNEDVAGDQTAGRNQAHDLADITNPAAGEDVFVTQRWDPLDPEANMIWSFPVSVERTYKVVLFFSEMYGEGLETRKFDIFVNGVQQEDDFNILQETGNSEKVGVEREYTVTASDDMLEIEFVNQEGIGGLMLPAVINAIEIVDIAAVNQPPVITAVEDQVSVEGQQISLQVSAVDPDGNLDDNLNSSQSVITSFTAENLPPGLTMDATGLIAGTIDADAEDVYDVRVIVLDSGFPTAGAIENLTWTVSNGDPVVTSPIEDFSRLFGDPADDFDLNTVFTDPLGSELTFTLEGNNNQDVVQESLTGAIMTLVYSSTVEGTALITVRATNQFDEFVEEQFNVTVIAAYPQALVQVTPEGGLGASTFNPSNIVVENNSPGSARITQVSIDLSTALYPDMVFDPAGTAGDSGFKCMTPDTGEEETGYITPVDNCVDPFSDPNEDGFYTLTITFDDFDSGEVFTFSVDADPTSIKGNADVGNAGAVGGIEMIGATVTVQFSDESTEVNDLFYIDGSLGGSETVARTNTTAAPGISIEGVVGSTATVSEAVQNIIVTGFAGQSVRLFQSDGRLNVNGVPGGGFDIEPYEANEAIGGVWDYTGVIGEGGTATIEVLLRASDKADGFGDGGLNHFMAVIDGEFQSRVSNKVVVELLTPSTATLMEGWNMVGISYGVADANYETIFGSLLPTRAPYLWSGSYVQVEEMAAGVGYWLEVENAGEVPIDGAEISSVDVTVSTGWNLVSGPSCIFDINNAGDPAGIIIPGNLYRFEGSYVASTSLTPNVGYWIEVSDDGTITFDCNSEEVAVVNESATRPKLAPHATFGVMRLSDDLDRNQDLYFGNELADKTTKRQYNMPPLTLDGFDVRFADHSRLTEGNAGVIRVQGASFPIKLEMVSGPQGVQEILFIEALAGEEVVESFQVYEGDAIVISNEEVTALRLGTDTMELATLPEAFELTGNYPNPFNPTTSIIFDLPEDASMQVAIYDLLGRQVMLLDAVEMAAGAAKQIQLDASSLASGTYLYKVQARMASGSVVSTGRMTLLK